MAMKHETIFTFPLVHKAGKGDTRVETKRTTSACTTTGKRLPSNTAILKTHVILCYTTALLYSISSADILPASNVILV